MTSRSAFIRMGAMVVAAGLWSLACSDSLTEVENQVTVTVSPATSTLVSLGDQLQLAAKVEVTRGAVPSPVWLTRDVDVAAVGDDGRVRAIGNGETWIVAMAEADGIEGRDSARIVVQQVPASVRLEKTLDTLTWIGQTTRLTAVAMDARGNPVAGAGLAWASSDQTMAAVDSTGTVTARGNGYAQISAAAGDAVAFVTLSVAQQVADVTVSPAAVTITIGATQQFTATATDAGGTPIPGVNFLWVSANANVAVVDTTGLATGKGVGAVTVTAVGRGEPGNAVLTVGTSPTTPTKLAFSVQPATSVAGQALSPAVEVELRDANDNLVPTARNAVTLAIAANPGSGTLSGTKTVTAVNGVASFSGLSINKTGTGYTISASATSLTGATSSTFAITPAAPVKLAFGTQPAETEGNVAFNPAVTVTIRDQFDNVVTGATNAVTIALGVNPWASIFSTGGTLAGTKTVNAAAGVATFNGLKIDKPGPGYTMVATATGLTGVTSNAFKIKLTVQSFAAAEDGAHTCAVTAGGTYCWGYNAYGQVGDGTTIQDSVARLVVTGQTFTSLTAGTYHTCGLTAAGAAYCWGRNVEGQLGDGTNDQRLAPTAVTGGHTFTALTAGRYHTCGVSGTSIYCWGYDGYGQLGDDANFANKNAPTVVTGGTGQWGGVTAGRYHTCGRASSGATGDAYCWGRDSEGQLGNDKAFSGNLPTPAAVRDSLGNAKTWKQLDAGMYHTCGVDANDAGFCWGYNPYGQLGVDTTAVTGTPVGTYRGTPIVVFGGLTFARIRAAQVHTCGTTLSGDTYCWGYNSNGELGSGSFGGPNNSNRIPLRTLVVGSHTFTSLDDGGPYTCGREGAASLWCWGYNGNAQLGIGSRQSQPEPTQIVQ